ncbi:MAG: segregation/condensation protein A [Planctomycetes bacterium]|nr:segregation/condensation protein A [Planctomycetota bacterium]
MIEPADPDLLPAAKMPAPGPGPVAADEAMDFTVHLERVFQGPLDLLLQLVRDKELEIHVVSLAEVCDAYCQYVRSMERIDVDEAADFLVVAATLLAIKSRSLLPHEELDEDEDPFDPGEELVQQLLVYKELRQAADSLGASWRRRAKLLPAGGKWLGKYDLDEDEEEEEWELGEVSVWDLLKVFRRLEKETGFMRPHRVREQGRPLSWYVEEVWSRIEGGGKLSLREVFTQEQTFREDAAYYLVALLELAKQQAIDLEQTDTFGDILVSRSSQQVEIHLEELDEGFDRHADEMEPEVGDLLEEDAL